MQSINLELKCYNYFHLNKPSDSRSALIFAIKLLSYTTLIAPFIMGVIYNTARLHNYRVRQISQKESKIPPFKLLNRDIQYTYLEKFKLQPGETIDVLRDIERYHIRDEKILIELASVLVENDPFDFARFGHQFQIQDKKALAKLAKQIAEKSIYAFEYIKKLNLEDPAVLFELAEILVKKNPSDFCEKIQIFRIQDQHLLLKLLKQVSPYFLSQNFENLGISDQKVLLELAKYWIDESPYDFCKNLQLFCFSDLASKIGLIDYALKKCDHDIICEHLEKFKIDDQRSLYEVAKQIKWNEIRSQRLIEYIKKFNLGGEGNYIELVEMIAKIHPRYISKNVDLLELKEEKDRVTIANTLLEWQWGTTDLACNLNKFHISNQKALVGFAKRCATDGILSRYISNFKIEDAVTRFELAKIAIAEGDCFSKHMQKYQITQQEHLVELAKLAAKDDKCFSKNVEKFGFIDSVLLNELLEICVASHQPISKHIQKFKISNQETLIAIARKVAKYDKTFVSNIKKFHIMDKAILAELAVTASQNRLPCLSRCIEDFCILDQNLLIKIAKELAQYDPDFAFWVENFNIGNQEVLTELAEMAVENRLPFISQCIENFKIQDPLKRISLAKKLTMYDSYFLEYVDRFAIEDATALCEIAAISFIQSDCKYFLENFDRFKLSKKQLPKVVLPVIAYDLDYLDKALKVLQITPSDLNSVSLKELKFLTSYFEKQSEEGQQHLRLWLQYIKLFYLNEQKTQIDLSELIRSELETFEKLYLAIARLHHPNLRYKLAFSAFEAFETKEGITEYKEFLKSSAHPLIALLLYQLHKSFHESKPLLEQLASECRKKKSSLKDAKLLISLLDTLILVALAEKFEPLEFILRALQKNSMQMQQELFAIQGIVQCEEIALFSQKEKTIQDLFQEAFKKLIPIDREDFFESYMETIGKEPDANSLLVYAGRLKTIQNAEDKKIALDLLTFFVKSILNGTYLEMRYRENNHTKTLFKDRLKLKTQWVKGAKQSFYIKASSTSINYENQFKYALQHKHLVSVPHLEEYLNHLETRAKVKEKLLSLKKDPKIEIQLLAIELIEGVEETENQLKKLFELRQLLQEVNDSPEFDNDIKTSIETLKKQQVIGGEVILHDTDNAWEMFMSGSRVNGSCQRVDGSVELNMCLISLPIDPKRRLFWVEKKGKMVARTIVRLLIDKKNRPVLMQERVYPATASQEIKDVLTQFAKQRAKALGVPLYQEGDQPSHLRSLYAPFYEYVDSHRIEHIHKKGVYTIPTANLIKGSVPLEQTVRKIMKRYLKRMNSQ